MRLGTEGQGTYPLDLPAPYHIQVEAGQNLVGGILIIGQPGIDAGELGHKKHPNAPLEGF